MTPHAPRAGIAYTTSTEHYSKAVFTNSAQIGALTHRTNLALGYTKVALQGYEFRDIKYYCIWVQWYKIGTSNAVPVVCAVGYQ